MKGVRLKAKAQTFYFSGLFFVSHWLELHKEQKGFWLNLIVDYASPEYFLLVFGSVKIKSLGVGKFRLTAILLGRTAFLKVVQLRFSMAHLFLL